MTYTARLARTSLLGFALIPLLATAALAQDEDEEPIEYDFAAEAFAPAPMKMRMRASYGATPGGAQDVAYFRDRVEEGEVPLPETFTSEGLLSEHDLPLTGGPCDRMLCTNAKAVSAHLANQGEVRYLMQLGFTSGLDASWTRDPLNLVAVIDQSGSMSGAPLQTVRDSLSELVRSHLREGDQLSIVLYGSGTTTWLEPTPFHGSARQELLQRIAAIPSEGSTNMEAGMAHGFQVARTTARRFDGTTRVMLFTDERPNTGNTEASGFMGQARSASADGIGMTTVGVGVQFGAELAAQISAVRGGNLFFFPDTEAMITRFREDFDTMVTELAYDLSVDVDPAPGLRLAGVYGVPGDLVEWTEDGLQLTVETLFLSRNQGGIYLAFAPEEGAARRITSVADIGLSYEPRDGSAVQTLASAAVVTPGAGDEGLSRGVALVDMATTLTRAAALHHRDNDQEQAWQLVHGLQGRLATSSDPDLDKERALVGKLEDTLATLAGRQGERPVAQARDEFTGLPQ